MKRFTLILSLLVIMVTTAMAEKEISISPTTGSFTRSNQGKSWHGEWTSTAVDGVQVVLTASGYANNMTVADDKVEMWTGTSNTTLYTLSVTSGHVITGYSFDFIGKNAKDNRFVTISTTNKTDNATAESKNFAIKGLNTRTTEFTFAGYVEGSAEDKNNGVIVTNFKVYVDDAASIPAGVTIANGLVKVSDYPKNGEWAENTTWYFIDNKRGGIISASNKNNNDYLTLKSNTITGLDDENAMWCVVGAEGGYKFYNKANGTSKTIYSERPGDTDQAKVKIADNTAALYEIFDIEASKKSGYVVIKDHNNGNNYWNERSANLGYWNSSSATNDDGSAFMFIDLNEVNGLVDGANELLEEAAAQYVSVVTPIDLTRNNYEMLYCNAPCKYTQWGDQFEGHWEYLFDNDPATILHTEYGNGYTSEDGLKEHYLRVDMGENESIEKFQFSIGTRNKNCDANSPTTIVVEGCNEENGKYETIGTVTGIPKQNSYTYTSGILTNGKAYRFIRFRVTATANNGKNPAGELFFYIAEFGMSKVEETFSVNENYKEYAELIKTLYIAKDEVVNVTDLGMLPSNKVALVNAKEAYLEARYPDYYALRDKVEEQNFYVQNRGNSVGCYATSDEFVATVQAAEATLADITNVAAHSAALATLNTLEIPTLILPEEGKFYNIVNVLNTNGIVYSGSDSKIYWEAGKTGSRAVWQFVNNGDGTYEIVSVHNQQNIKELVWANPSNLGNESDMNFVLTGLGDRMLTIISNPKTSKRTMHAQGGGALVYYNIHDKGDAGSWYVNEVESFSHTLKVGTAGWSTLVLGFNATIPTANDFKAYTVASVEDGYIKLEEATGVLGANTPIIVNAPAGDYKFVYTADEATVAPATDVLKGTLYDKNIEADAYVLGIKNDNVGLYKAEKNISTNVDNDSTEETTYEAFKNNANKAYLVVPGASEVASYSFRFGEGTTGVENVVVENEVKAIYDLTGRRVEAITAPGIYIVNGKKVLVK